MALSSEAVSSLLGLLYEASAEPEQWPGFFAALSDYAQAPAAYFGLVDPAGHCSLALNPGVDPAWQRAYTEYFYRRDVLLDRFVGLKNEHGDWIGTSQSVISDQEYHRSSIYNEHLKPQGLLHQCAAVLGGLNGGMEGGLGMMRAPHQKPFDNDMVSLLAMLVPHLKRAVNTQRTFSELRDRNRELRHCVEVLDQGLIRLDGCGRVTLMTTAARTILDARDGIELDRGFLRAAVPGEQRRLTKLVAGAVATGSGRGTDLAVPCSTASAPQAGSKPHWTAPSGGAMLISRRPPRRPLRLVVTPFRSTSTLLEDRPVAAVFLNDPDAQLPSRAMILRSLYGLTPAEGRLADLLAQGWALGSASEQMKMTAGTARFHLKAIFRKTGAVRQSDLVRMVAGLPAGWTSQA
jgi:DNA-binding CsgD family transcriptional regulator